MESKSLLLLVLLTATPGCSGESGKQTSPIVPGPGQIVMPPKQSAVNMVSISSTIMSPPAEYSSAQDAFDAMQVAIANKQLQLAAETMTRETQAGIAGSLAFRLSLVAAEGDRTADTIARLFDVHGLNGETSGTTAEDNGAASMMRSIGNSIRGRSVFIERAIKILRKLKEDDGNFFVVGTLVDLELNDESGTGNLQLEDSVRPLEFRNQNGAWFVHIPDQTFEQ